MNDFLSKLSIYDQLGYLAVGGLFYMCLLYDQAYVGFTISKVASSPFSVAIVVYFLGHVAQSLARTIMELMPKLKPKPYEMPDTILGQINKAVVEPTLEKPQAFHVCFLYALSVDKTGRVEIMNARYSLYRGWTFVLALQAVGSLVIFCYCLWEDTPDYGLLTGCLMCAILAWIMADRSAYFYQAIAHRTINTFLLTKTDSLLPAAK